MYVLLACVLDVSNSQVPHAIELFSSLFSSVFGSLFGKVSNARTTFETMVPNEIANRTETATAHSIERTLATPPPLMVTSAVVRCPPIPRSQRLDRGIGEHLQLEGPGGTNRRDG